MEKKSENAIDHIIIPTETSRIFHDFSFLNTGLKNDAKRLNPKNHIIEAVTAPVPKNIFPELPIDELMLPRRKTVSR